MNYQSYVFCGGKIFRPAGFRRVEKGEYYLAVNGSVRVRPISSAEGFKSPRFVMRELTGAEYRRLQEEILAGIIGVLWVRV